MKVSGILLHLRSSLMCDRATVSSAMKSMTESV